MHCSRALAVVVSCLRSSSSSCSGSSTLRYNFHTSTPYSSSSSRQKKGCSSLAAAGGPAVDAWRGTENQQRHYQRAQQQQLQINSKEQKLLSAAAARWQRFWHRENPHAPQLINTMRSSSSNSSDRNDGKSSSSKQSDSNSGNGSNSNNSSSINRNNSSNKDVVHVVLINLGSPKKPTYTALWKYLGQFLGDRRIVELPRAFWLPLLHLIILPFRSLLSAKRYALIWLSAEDVKERLSAAAAALQQRQRQQPSLLQKQVHDVLEGGSAPPLLVHLLALAARLQQRLDELQQQQQQQQEPDQQQQQQREQQQSLPRFEVVACVRYGNPSIGNCLQQLQQQHQQLKLLLLPLYPQPTASCTGSAFDSVFHELTKWRVMPDLRIVAGYWSNAVYIHSIASSIRKFWQQNGRGEHLLFSYHGIPRAVSWAAGDPYVCLCFQTTRLVAQQLGLKAGEYEVAMQSRAGCSEWTQPYIVPTLQALASAGCRSVDVVLPGFSVDCLETLEEIQIEAVTLFKKYTGGVGVLRVIPCLNASDEGVALLEALVLSNTAQWNKQSPCR